MIYLEPSNRTFTDLGLFSFLYYAVEQQTHATSTLCITLQQWSLLFSDAEESLATLTVIANSKMRQHLTCSF